MKKEDVTGFIVYIIILALAVVFGLTVLQTHAEKGTSLYGFMYVLYILGAIVSGVVLNAFLFEFAHIIGAKIGGYQIISVNILGFNWKLDEQGKYKFHFSSFDGLTGETKIIPKKNLSKEANPYPYLLFGTLFFVIEVVIVMIVFSMFKSSEDVGLTDLAYGVLTLGMIGLMVFIYNILPFQLDAITDGYRFTTVSNPKNKAAFNELLRVQYEIECGNDVDIKIFDEITNYTADLNLNKVYLLLDKRSFVEAEEILDLIISAKENVSEKVYIRAKAQKIYINLMTKTIEESKEFYDKFVPVSERRSISNDVSMASIRAYLLMSGLLDRSRSECIIALNNVLKAYKHTPKNRQSIEISLFNECLQKIIDVHPGWDLSDYLLVEQK